MPDIEGVAPAPPAAMPLVVAAAAAQPDLFVVPLKMRGCYPVDLGSADCGEVCRGVDGFDYVIKDGKAGASHPLVPHCEWFCTQLGEMVGLAAPPAKVALKPNGEMQFGSRWEGGVVKATAADPSTWWEKIKDGRIDLAVAKLSLSRIYAFDLFVHNVDRHLNNFMFRGHRDGDVGVIANDYSRAWIGHGFPLPDLPIAGHTVDAYRWLAGFLGEQYIVQDEVDSVIDLLLEIQKPSVQRIMEGHPRDWLPNDKRDAILDWWGSPAMTARLRGISEGIRNATYL